MPWLKPSIGGGRHGGHNFSNRLFQSGLGFRAQDLLCLDFADELRLIALEILSQFAGELNNLFNSGLRPAINVGISVSRVGGAAQTKAIKKIAGTLKLELAQFDELAAFSQFASDLDAATQQQLSRGKRLRELLKQSQFSPLILAEQVAIVYAGVKGLIDDVPVEEVVQFSRELREYLKSNKPDFISKIQTEKVLSPEAETTLKEAIAEVVSTMMASAN